MLPQNDTGAKGDQSAAKQVYVANLFDTSNLKWVTEIFDLAVDLINDHNDGWFDGVLDDGTEIVATTEDSGCDPRTSLPAYWNLRTNWGPDDEGGHGVRGVPPLLHGVVGCRCSGATAAVARVAGLEGVPVVSPVSSAADLSDETEFPSLSRLVGPDDGRGQVGALVALLRSMGWSRVSVLATDTKYTKDLATAFGNAWVGDHDGDGDGDGSDDTVWTGEVAYSHTIALGADDAVDEASVLRSLNSAPTDNPRTNSRVILLLAHHHHAYPILKIARNIKFQPDTIWIGTAAWSDRLPADGGDTSWMPDVPAFLGLVPYRNRDDVYKDFLQRLRARQQARGLPVFNDLPDYSAEMLVDSLLALVMALSRVRPDQRGDGQAVLSELRSLEFSGLSGPVSFTADRDRANPRYSVINWQSNSEFAEVGHVGTTLDSAKIRMQDICWLANLGCGLDEAPSDKYAVPLLRLPAWVWAIISILVASVLAGLYLFFRLRRSRQKIREYFEEHLAVAEAKRNIEGEIESREEEIDELKQRLTYLVRQPLDPQDKPSTWSDSCNILVEVSPNEPDFQIVSDKLRESMDDARVTRLYRVQNHPLWIYYNFHKRRLRNSGVTDFNEKLFVWHGTRGNDPAQICTDIQDGFLMQYAHKGLWGRGIYFAEKSCYSDENYAFRPAAAHSAAEGNEQPIITKKRCANAGNDERELILARLLAGKETFIERPRPNLKVPPPVNPTSLQRYNTVWSYTKGKNGIATRVWIVYENGRAFPEYLVRYARGKRDSPP